MARKVGLRAFEYKAKSGEQRFELEVMLSDDLRFFYRDAQVPKVLREFFPHGFESANGRSYFASIGELDSHVKKACEVYSERTVDAVRERVIVYRMNLNGNLTPDLSRGDKGARIFDDLERHGQVGMALDWSVMWRVKVGKNVTYHRGYTLLDETEKVGNEEWVTDEQRVMDWTAEREAWFQRVEDQLLKMVDMADQFFHQDSSALVEVIAQKGLFQLVGRKR